MSRTSITRLSRKASSDRAALDRLLDTVHIGHFAIVADDAHPVVLPTAVVRDGDRVLAHGSTGSRWLRRLAAGMSACHHRARAANDASRAGALPPAISSVSMPPATSSAVTVTQVMRSAHLVGASRASSSSSAMTCLRPPMIFWADAGQRAGECSALMPQAPSLARDFACRSRSQRSGCSPELPACFLLTQTEQRLRLLIHLASGGAFPGRLTRKHFETAADSLCALLEDRAL